MLKNKGGFFITGIFHRNSTDRVIPKSSFPDFCIYGKLQATPSDPDRFQAILKNRHGRFSGGDFFYEIACIFCIQQLSASTKHVS